MYTEISKLSTNPVAATSSKVDSTHNVYFDGIGRVEDTPVFLLGNLEVGDEIRGPAMIIDETQTIVLIPDARAVVTSRHLYITLD